MATTATYYSNLLQDALDSGKLRNYNKAASLLEKIVSETDLLPEALLYLGRSYHALGNYEKSISIYKHFILHMPDESAGYFFLGRTYLTMKMYEYAVHYLKKAHNLDPDNTQVLSFLGLSYLKIKRPEMASAILGRAVELGGYNRRIYNGYLNALSAHAVKEFYSGNFELASQMFQFLLDNGYQSNFVHVYLGLLAREEGNYERALSHYNTALESAPDDVSLKLRQAAMLYFTGAKGEAIKSVESLKRQFPYIQSDIFNKNGITRSLCIHHFQNEQFRKAIYLGNETLKNNYSDAVVHGIVGESHRILGDLSKAQNHLLRAVESEPSSSEIRYGLAMVYWQEKKYQAMLDELHKILRNEPDNQSAQFFIVMCKCRLNYAPETTIPLVQEAIRNLGPDPSLFTVLGGQYIRGDLDHLADKWFEKALQLQPDNREAYDQLLQLYKSHKRDKDLEDLYCRFFSVFPNDKNLRKDYIIFLISKENYSDAINQILKYLPFRTNDEKIKRLLALCYRKNEQFQDALILYKELLVKKPEFEEYIKALVFCYEKIGKVSFATEFLGKALNEIKPSVTLLLIYGSLLYKNGNDEKALEMFRKAADMDPEDGRAYRNISIVYKNKGMKDLSDKFSGHADQIDKKTVG